MMKSTEDGFGFNRRTFGQPMTVGLERNGRFCREGSRKSAKPTGLVAVCFGIALFSCLPRLAYPTQSIEPCLQVDVREEHIYGGVFRITLYRSGKAAVGYVGFDTFVTWLKEERISTLCEAFMSAIPSSRNQAIYSEEEGARRLGGVRHIVIRPEMGSAVAFSAFPPDVLLISETELGRQLRKLDKLLRRKFCDYYCIDKRCRYTPLGYVGNGN